ncbi:MAG: hypothetical protein V3U43_00965, partial [Pseudomonadales bacterium]
LLVSASAYVALEGPPPWLVRVARPYLPQLFEEPAAPPAQPATQPAAEVPRVAVAPATPLAGEVVPSTQTDGVPAQTQSSSPEVLEARLADARTLAQTPLSNAVVLAATYRAVLAIDPTNVEATTGLAALANALLGATEEALSQGGLEEGQRLVGLALTVFPGDPRFSLLASDANVQLGIQRLLQQAGTLPRAQAVAAYRQVLARSPGNTEALRGLEVVAESYASDALDAVNSGDLERAEVILEDASALVLTHGELDGVREAVATSRARAGQIGQLMAEGRALLAKGDSRGAARKFNSVLELDGSMGDARAQLQRATRDIARSGSRALTRGDLDTAQARLSEASRYLRNQEQVVALRRDVATAKAQRARVAELYGTAQDRLARGLLSRPVDDCASYYLNSVLELEPNHSDARAALAKVATRLAEIAVEAREVGLDDASEDYIRRALELRPGDETWTVLLREWESVDAAAAVEAAAAS